MRLPLPNKVIERFIEKMGLKVFLSAESTEMTVMVKVEVMRGSILEYKITDFWEIYDGDELGWEESGEDEILARDGIFIYLADNDSVDNFFTELSLNYAKKHLRKKNIRT